MVALKIHRKKYADAGWREAKILRLLGATEEGCGIVRLLEVGEADGHVCLAFERHGRSVDHWVDQRPFSVATTRRVTVQLLRALERIHSAGLVHTDVKSGNILYDPRRREARLADLGNARPTLRQGALLGSREYTAPEVLIGAPLDRKVDLWALGCCVFEMLAGQVLFRPRAAAEKKYVEFDRRKGAKLTGRARAEADAEVAEQFSVGDVVGGRYRLRAVLGQGKFATVWTAMPVANARPFSGESPLPNREEPPGERRESAASWRRKKGAVDLLDLALNYELAILMARLGGPFPSEWMGSALYRESYFEADGELRFRPAIRRDPIGNQLKRRTRLRGATWEAAADFLNGLLVLDPARRVGVREALAHPWLRSSG